MHQMDAQPVVRQRVQVRRDVAGRVEGPAEVLHLEDQPIREALDRDVDGLSPPALVGVLDGVGAELAHRQHQGRPGLPLHSQPGHLGPQPLAEPREVTRLARQREAAGGRRVTFWPGHALRPTSRDSV